MCSSEAVPMSNVYLYINEHNLYNAELHHISFTSNDIHIYISDMKTPTDVC